MKIKQIEIKNFGKLSDFELAFGDNQNIIYGRNEQGKSTIMAFIKAMFYGFSNPRNKDVLKDLRRRYLPWNGQSISGALEFDFDGKTYRIERSFGDTARKDTLRIINKSLNRAEDLPAKDEPGRKYFDMSESSFEKSVFIGQIGSVIDLENEKENEIIKRLQNLASSGDETQSFGDVDNNLQTAIEKIKSRSGRIGEYDKLIKAESVLAEDRIDAIDMEEHKLKMQNEYLELGDKREKVSQLLKAAEKECDEQARYIKFKKLSRIILKSKEIEKLSDDLNLSAAKLEKDGFVVTLEFIEDIKNRLQILQSENSLIIDKEKELVQFKENLAAYDSSQQESFSKDEFDMASSTVNLLASLKDRKSQLEFGIGNMQIKLSQGSKDHEELQKLIAKQADYSKRISDLEGQHAKVQDALDRKPDVAISKPFPKLFVATALVIALLSAVAAFIIPLLPLFALTVLAVISIPVRLIVHSRKGTASGPGDANRTNENQALIQSLSDTILFDKAALAEIESQIIKLSQSPGNSRTSEEIQGEIETLNAELTECKDSIDKNEALINGYFMKYGVQDFKSLQEKYINMAATLEQVNSQKELVNQKSTQLTDIKLRHAENRKRFEELFAKINTDKSFNPSNFDEASEKVNEIVALFYEVANSRKLIDDKQKDLRYELNGTTLSVIKIELDEMLQTYGNTIATVADGETCIPGNDLVNSKLAMLRDEFHTIDNEMVQMQTKMSHEFLGKKELSEIDEEIKANRQLQDYYLYQYEALSVARKALQDSFEDMQQSFGPIVNQKCAGIFSHLTAGKYQDLMVSKDLNISVREPFGNTTHEWKYLSNGTIDQVYFSLRLAISEIFTGSGNGLPLFLDDAFLQYDDDRARNAMDFIGEYSKEKDAQVFLFTCHNSLLGFAASDARIIQI